jgi:hypothetical protein
MNNLAAKTQDQLTFAMISDYILMSGDLLTQNEVMVLIALCRFQKFGGKSFEARYESRDTIGKIARITPRTVTKVKTALMKKGYIICTRRNEEARDPGIPFDSKRLQGSDYIQMTPKLENEYRLKLGKNLSTFKPKAVSNSVHRGEKNVREGGTDFHQTRYPENIDTIYNTTAHAARQAPVQKSSGEAKEVWDAYGKAGLPKGTSFAVFGKKYEAEKPKKSHMMARVQRLAEDPVLIYQCRTINFLFFIKNQNSNAIQSSNSIRSGIASAYASARYQSDRETLVADECRALNCTPGKLVEWANLSEGMTQTRLDLWSYKDDSARILFGDVQDDSKDPTYEEWARFGNNSTVTT